MADGSVQLFIDTNRDGQLNNGFPASSQTGFTDEQTELEQKAMFSKGSLRQL
jgi:hypothetical protein